MAKSIRLFSKNHATLDPEAPTAISILARRRQAANNDVYEVDLGRLLTPAGSRLRLEVLPDPSLPDDGPGRAPLFSVGDFILTEIHVEAIEGKK